MRLLICFFGVLLAFSSADDTESVQARIARAMSAGPSEIAKSARIVDTDSNGKTVVLREGNNGLMCMPGNPKVIGDPAMCADATSMQWAADFRAHKPKPTNTVPGITYMAGRRDAAQRFRSLRQNQSADHRSPALDDHVALRS
jgi:hypothetical protein